MEAGASLFRDEGSGAGSDALDAANSDALLAAFVDDLLLPAGALSNDVDSAPLAAQLEEQGEVELPFDGGRAWRCLDYLHVRGCALCQPPPAEGEEDAVELRGVDGKKNGEKRLRSLLARAPEWLNATTREAAARACDEAAAAGGAAAASHARLAAALRARHCVEMRKADLLQLCRLWRYRCDVWRRRRNDAAAGSGGGAAGVPAPTEPPLAALPHWQPSFSAQQQQQQQQQQLMVPSGAATLAAGSAESLLQALPAAAAAAVAGGGSDLRALAARAVTSFSGLERTQWLLGAIAEVPPAAKPYYLVSLRRKVHFLQYAQAQASGMLERAREAHAALQAPLLMMAPEERTRAAWLALVGRGEEPLARMLNELGALAEQVMDDAPRIVIPAAALGDADPGAADVSVYAGDPAHAAGSRTMLELATRGTACLAALRLAPYGDYVHGVTALLALLIGFSAASVAAIQLHLDLMLPVSNAA